jgi:hypothetical protein
VRASVSAVFETLKVRREGAVLSTYIAARRAAIASDRSLIRLQKFRPGALLRSRSARRKSFPLLADLPRNKS